MVDSHRSTDAPRTAARVHVQKFGTFLSNMIMPNIGAIIAWGLHHRVLHPGRVDAQREDRHDGRPGHLLPAADPDRLHRRPDRLRRSAAAWSAASRRIGVILATSDPIFIGDDGTGVADVPRRDDHGPARRAWVMKQLDALWDGKIKPGFEMLVDNFSAGIVGRASWRSAACSCSAPVLRR